MRKTKLSVVTTTAFKKDYKLAIKRGLNIKLLEDIVVASPWEKHSQKNAWIIPLRVIGPGIVNVIFSQTGY